MCQRARCCVRSCLSVECVNRETCAHDLVSYIWLSVECLKSYAISAGGVSRPTGCRRRSRHNWKTKKKNNIWKYTQPHENIYVCIFSCRVIARARKCNKFSFWFFFFARLEFMKKPQTLKNLSSTPTMYVCLKHTLIGDWRFNNARVPI